MKQFRQEIDIIKHTLRIEEDPLFKEINPLGIVNYEVEWVKSEVNGKSENGNYVIFYSFGQLKTG